MKSGRNNRGKTSVIDVDRYVQVRERVLTFFLKLLKYIHETTIGNYYLTSVGKWREGSRSMKLIKLHKTIIAANLGNEMNNLCRELIVDGKKVFCTKHPLIFLKSLIIVTSWESRAIRKFLEAIREKGYLNPEDRQTIIQLLEQELKQLRQAG